MIFVYGAVLCLLLLGLKKKKAVCREAVFLLMAGCILSSILWIKERVVKDFSKKPAIERNEKGETAKSVTVIADTGEEKEVLQLEISPKSYGREELEMLFYDMLPELDCAILGENLSVNAISSNMIFPEQIEGYPFLLQWKSSRPEMVDAEGKLGREIPEEGCLVEIGAKVLYAEENFAEEYLFCVQVFPPIEENSFFSRLTKEIQSQESKLRKENTYLLPEGFEGKKIQWQEKKEDNSLAFFLLAGIGAAGIYAGKRKEKENVEKKRKKEMEKAYPEIICKTALFIGAGMTAQKALRKIGKEYEKMKENNPAGEEILVACREMDSGVSETEVYKRLGQRCGLPAYVRYGALLIRHVKQGASGLKEAFGEETKEAFKERKERARRLGEEAGTKLLGPMVVLLILVMVIIMVPAFTAFSI